jgi:hypothetical protein
MEKATSGRHMPFEHKSGMEVEGNKSEEHGAYNSYNEVHRSLEHGESGVRNDGLDNTIARHNSDHPDMQPIVNSKEGSNYDYGNKSEAAAPCTDCI